VKFFCESDQAFLCSKCVCLHTGAGHLITECKLDISRVRSDFADVKLKYQALLDEAEQMRSALDSAEKKLGDMQLKQKNKLDITFKSMMNALEIKRNEFLSIMHDFYKDQRSKVSFDKNRAQTFLSKVK
jgi:hypothetical protein